VKKSGEASPGFGHGKTGREKIDNEPGLKNYGLRKNGKRGSFVGGRLRPREIERGRSVLKVITWEGHRPT